MNQRYVGPGTGADTGAAVCAGADCRRREAAGGTRRPAPGRSRLCPLCRDLLATGVRGLPGLYEECGRLLSGSAGPRERTSGGPLPGMPFNDAAAEARSAILGVLRCWTALIVEERRTTAPPRTVGALAAWIGAHADWLAAHDAAGDVSEEVAGAVRLARRVVDPGDRRRTPVGRCVESGCPGDLTATVRAREPRAAMEISCDADPAHRWPGHEWLRLSRLMAAGGERAGGAVAGPDAARARWITAVDIARLWDVARGSVYRHASEQEWRRRKREGRTYYHEADVRRTFDGRDAGPVAARADA